MAPSYDAAIFDLEDDLSTRNSSAIRALPKNLIRLMIANNIWFDFECHRLSADKAQQS
jgi:hypothetical protein